MADARLEAALRNRELLERVAERDSRLPRRKVKRAARWWDDTRDFLIDQTKRTSRGSETK
jgi:hypothetical protein